MTPTARTLLLSLSLLSPALYADVRVEVPDLPAELQDPVRNALPLVREEGSLSAARVHAQGTASLGVRSGGFFLRFY